jgi:hypothetical protein
MMTLTKPEFRTSASVHQSLDQSQQLDRADIAKSANEPLGGKLAPLAF